VAPFYPSSTILSTPPYKLGRDLLNFKDYFNLYYLFFSSGFIPPLNTSSVQVGPRPRPRLRLVACLVLIFHRFSTEKHKKNGESCQTNLRLHRFFTPLLLFASNFWKHSLQNARRIAILGKAAVRRRPYRLTASAPPSRPPRPRLRCRGHHRLQGAFYGDIPRRSLRSPPGDAP
jgi:hypothetical protein